MTTDIDTRLDEILDNIEEYFVVGALGGSPFNSSEENDKLREDAVNNGRKYAKQAIKQLIEDEFEKLTKMYYASPDKSEYQAGYNSALDELRQKLEEWKQ